MWAAVQASVSSPVLSATNGPFGPLVADETGLETEAWMAARVPRHFYSRRHFSAYLGAEVTAPFITNIQHSSPPNTSLIETPAVKAPLALKALGRVSAAWTACALCHSTRFIAKPCKGQGAGSEMVSDKAVDGQSNPDERELQASVLPGSRQRPKGCPRIPVAQNCHRLLSSSLSASGAAPKPSCSPSQLQPLWLPSHPSKPNTPQNAMVPGVTVASCFICVEAKIFPGILVKQNTLC